MAIRIEGRQQGKLIWILRGMLLLLVCPGWSPWIGAQNLGLLPAAGREESSPTGLLLVVSLEIEEAVQKGAAVSPARWEESLAASLATLPKVGGVFQAQFLGAPGGINTALGEVGLIPGDKAQKKGVPPSADGVRAFSPADHAGGGPGLVLSKALSPEETPLSGLPQFPPTEKENALLRWAAPRNYDYLVSGTLSLANPSPSPTEEGGGTPGVSPPEKGSQVSVRLFLRDVVNLKIIHTLEWKAPIPSEEELYQTFWLPLLDQVANLTPTDYVTSLTIQGRPGTRIRGFTETPVILPEEGTLVIQVPKLHSFFWHAMIPGHEDLSGSWLAVNEEETLVLSSPPLLRNTLEWGMLRGQFGDFWMGRYFFRNRLHLKIGLAQYLVGFYFPTAWESEASLIISLPMLLPGLVGEWYFGENHHFLQTYVALGTLFRVNLDQAALDPVAPLILFGRCGILWRASREWSFFAELGLDFYPLADGPLLVASQKTTTDSGGAFFLYHDRWYLDLFVFRWGVRMRYE